MHLLMWLTPRMVACGSIYFSFHYLTYPHTVCYKLDLKAKRLAINGTAGNRGRTTSLVLNCSFQPSLLWTQVHFPKWLPKPFWTCTEMQKTSPGCFTTSPPTQADCPAKGENAGCIRTLQQYSIMPSLDGLQLTCKEEREWGEWMFQNLTPVTRHNEQVKQPRVHSLSPTVGILECLPCGKRQSYPSDLSADQNSSKL